MILVEAAQHMIVSKHAPKEESLLSWGSNHQPLENQPDALTTPPQSARYYPSVFLTYDLYYPPLLADYIVERIETFETLASR